jgi:hypothetical protein
MNFQLEYSIGPTDYVAQQRTADPAGFTRFRNQYWRGVVLSLAVNGAGLWASMEANIAALVFGFLCMLIAGVVQIFRHQHYYDKALSAALAVHRPSKQVNLRVDDRGVFEAIEGVEHFAPWEAVKSYAMTDRVILLELGGGFWSIIPRSAFGKLSDAASEEFLEGLRSKSILKHASSLQ